MGELMHTGITAKPSRQFIDEVSRQQHAMAGAVIAISAAQAVALGEACMRLTLEHQPDSPALIHETHDLEQVAEIKNRLTAWGDRDAAAIAEFVALRAAGQELSGQQLLCTAPAEVCQLSLTAARILQAYRHLVAERVKDDLEISITLLAGTAQAAMLLLDSNLRIWPEPALLDQFESTLAGLNQQLSQLTPVARIRV
jgi:formiminotetrahydrofolate cyclodeaminase